MGKLKGPKTSKDLRIHVRRRAYERFGLSLTSDDIVKLSKLVQSNKAQFYDRQSGNVTRWIVPLHGQAVAVAYDKQRKCIRTIMPVDYLSTSKHDAMVQRAIEEAAYGAEAESDTLNQPSATGSTDPTGEEAAGGSDRGIKGGGTGNHD